MSREVVFYQTLSGEKPAEEFLAALPSKVRQKSSWVLKLLRELDRIPSIYFSKMPATDQIWECYIDYGSNAYRVLAFIDGSTVWLTNGFLKKRQKTPYGEIERAERYRKEHFEGRRG